TPGCAAARTRSRSRWPSTAWRSPRAEHPCLHRGPHGARLRAALSFPPPARAAAAARSAPSRCHPAPARLCRDGSPPDARCAAGGSGQVTCCLPGAGKVCRHEEGIVELSMAKGSQFVEGTQSAESAAAWKQQLDEDATGASDWVVGAVFGGTEQREGLELRDRQMLNMADLAAMGGTEPQLTGHIRTAVDDAGMSKEEVAECFVHLMPYIGVPKTLAAMRCMKTAFEG